MTTTSKTRSTSTHNKSAANDEKSVGIIVIDNGGYNTKVLSEDMQEPVVMASHKSFGHNNFRSLNDHYPEGTYKVKWNDKYYFFGLLTLQSRRPLTSYTSTKSTDYFILSVLKAVALYGYKKNKVVTTTPFSRYSDEEIQLIDNQLLGDHEIEINGTVYNFSIIDSVVAPEGLIASNATRPDGIHRWLDLGSRTVGYASTIGQSSTGYFEPIEGDSCGTIEKEGLEIRGVLEDKSETELNEYLSEYVENIYNNLSPIWEDSDPITAFGGGALVDALIDELQKRYPNLKVAPNPLTFQVEALMVVAKEIYSEMDSDE